MVGRVWAHGGAEALYRFLKRFSVKHADLRHRVYCSCSYRYWFWLLSDVIVCSV